MKLSNCDLIIILVLIIVVLVVYYLYLISDNLEQFQDATTESKATTKATSEKDILKELQDLCDKVNSKSTGTSISSPTSAPTGPTGAPTGPTSAPTGPTGAPTGPTSAPTATTLIDPLDPFSSFSPVTTTTL
jgi:hypothetical protein